MDSRAGSVTRIQTLRTFSAASRPLAGTDQKGDALAKGLPRPRGQCLVNCNIVRTEGITAAGNCSGHTCLADYRLERETNLKSPALFSHYLN